MSKPYTDDGIRYCQYLSSGHKACYWRDVVVPRLEGQKTVLLEALQEAAYALDVAEQYLAKAVSDGELAGCAVPVSYGYKTVYTHADQAHAAIRAARGEVK